MNASDIRVTETIALAPMTRADAAPLFALIDGDRAHLGRWLGFVALTWSVHDTAAFIESTLSDAARGRARVYTIRDGGSLVGVIGFNAIDRPNRVGEIGYWLVSSATGRGVMTEALRALLAHAHAAMGLHRCEVVVALGNIPSCAVAERAGMQREAVLRERIEHEARLLDAALYVAFPAPR